MAWERLEKLAEEMNCRCELLDIEIEQLEGNVKADHEEEVVEAPSLLGALSSCK